MLTVDAIYDVSDPVEFESRMLFSWGRMEGYPSVYFFYCRELNLVKIGYAADWKARLSQVQTDCPVEINCLYTIPGGEQEEAAIHAAFNHLRKRGEWFVFSQEIEAFFNSVRTVLRSALDKRNQ